MKNLITCCVILLAAGTSFACLFDGSENCFQSDNSTILASQYTDLRVVGSGGGQLNYTIAVKSPVGTVDVMFLDDPSFVSFALTRAPPSPLPTGSEMNTRRAVFSIVFLTPSVRHVIIYNHGATDVDILWEVTYSRDEGDSCWGFMAVVGAPILICLVVLFSMLLCRKQVAELCQSKEERMRALAEEEQPLRTDSSINPSTEYSYHQDAPKSDWRIAKWLQCPCKCPTVPCFGKPRARLPDYIRQNHDLLWPWYPFEDEILPFPVRVGCMISTLLFQLLVQTVWSTWFLGLQIVLVSDLAALFTTSIGSLLLRVTVGALASTLFSIILIPVARFCHHFSWRAADVSWKRNFARVVDCFVFVCLLGLVGLFLYYSWKLLEIYSCTSLLIDQLLPFLISVVVKSIFPGIPFILFMYCVQRSCGHAPKVTLESDNEGATDTSTDAQRAVEV